MVTGENARKPGATLAKGAESDMFRGSNRFWSHYVWTPCADGKVRRAPDDSFGLVDGLPRKILAALGDSIVWPVAAKIMRAIKSVEI